MRYGVAVYKSIRSILFFCIGLFLTLYLTHLVLQYLFDTLSTLQSWKLALLVFTVIAPILTIFMIHRKGRLRDVNSAWLLVLTTISTMALFILWDFIITIMNRTR